MRILLGLQPKTATQDSQIRSNYSKTYVNFFGWNQRQLDDLWTHDLNVVNFIITFSKIFAIYLAFIFEFNRCNSVIRVKFAIISVIQKDQQVYFNVLDCVGISVEEKFVPNISILKNPTKFVGIKNMNIWFWYFKYSFCTM